jgi:glycosyltransferase involved in cell wall biosynthesis
VESVTYGLALEVQRRLRLYQRWVDAFIAPSSFMADVLIRSGIDAGRVHVIPYGVPLHPNGAAADGRRFVLFLGRISAEKGIRTLLASSRLIPEVPILFAGEGPLVSELSRCGGAGVSHAGSLREEGVRAALEESAFTVLPSEWYENLPFAALESCAAREVAANRFSLDAHVREMIDLYANLAPADVNGDLLAGA